MLRRVNPLQRKALVRMTGVAVRMIMIVARLRGHLADRNYTTISDLASIAFKLDRGVVDVEVLLGQGIDLEQDAVAFRGWNVVNLHMTGERVGLRPKAPDV
jgi:hypothetical protein